MQVYINEMSAVEQPVLAVDHTGWNRPYAPTLKEHTYEHQAASIPGNTPVGVGFGYSTIVWIPENSGSWALPLRHKRISSWDTPITKGAFQLQQVCQHLQQRPNTVQLSPKAW